MTAAPEAVSLAAGRRIRAYPDVAPALSAIFAY
jgi:hypothetical protein